MGVMNADYDALDDVGDPDPGDLCGGCHGDGRCVECSGTGLGENQRRRCNRQNEAELAAKYAKEDRMAEWAEAVRGTHPEIAAAIENEIGPF